MNKSFKRKAFSKGIFLKEKIASALDWVAELDGLSQSWQLSEPLVIPSNGNYKMVVKFKILPNGNNWASIMAGEESSLVGSKSGVLAGKIRLVINGTTNWTNQDWVYSEHDTVEITRSPSGNKINFRGVESNISGSSDLIFTVLGVRASLHDFMPGYIEFVKLYKDDELKNHISLTNKDQGATQKPLVGNISAFMSNYTPAVWKKKAER